MLRNRGFFSGEADIGGRVIQKPISPITRPSSQMLPFWSLPVPKQAPPRHLPCPSPPTSKNQSHQLQGQELALKYDQTTRGQEALEKSPHQEIPPLHRKRELGESQDYIGEKKCLRERQYSVITTNIY